MISSKLCDCEFGQDITWFLWWFVVFHTKYSHTSFPKFLRKSKTCVNQICVMNLNWIMWLSFHFLPLEKRYCVTVHYTYLNVKIITQIKHPNSLKSASQDNHTITSHKHKVGIYLRRVADKKSQEPLIPHYWRHYTYVKWSTRNSSASWNISILMCDCNMYFMDFFNVTVFNCTGTSWIFLMLQCLIVQY